jgi:hypothetical protein
LKDKMFSIIYDNLLADSDYMKDTNNSRKWIGHILINY